MAHIRANYEKYFRKINYVLINRQYFRTLNTNQILRDIFGGKSHNEFLTIFSGADYWPNFK